MPNCPMSLSYLHVVLSYSVLGRYAHVHDFLMRMPDWLLPGLDYIIVAHPCICHGAYVHAPVLAHLQQETAMSDIVAKSSEGKA